MDEMSWGQRGAVLLSTLVITLVSLSINQAEPESRPGSTGPMDEAQVLPRPVATRRRSTVLTGDAQAAPRPAATLKRSTVPMAGGLAPQP
jgi:hypothetical protein